MGKKGVTKEMIEAIKKFKKSIGAERIVIFGSYASGRAGKDSDLDLILVSGKFRGKSFHERLKGMWLKWPIDLPVDFVPYTPEEFEKQSRRISLVRESILEGIEI